jgi:hypothetical protein
MNKSRIEKIKGSISNGLPPGCFINTFGLIQREHVTGEMIKTERFVKTIEHVLGHKIEKDPLGYALNKLEEGYGVAERKAKYYCICGQKIQNIYVLYTKDEPVNYGFIVGHHCVRLHVAKPTEMTKKVLLTDIYTPENVSHILRKQYNHKRHYERTILLKLKDHMSKYAYERKKLKFDKWKSIWQTYKNQLIKQLIHDSGPFSIPNSVKIDVILKWAEINPWFNTSFVLSLKNQLEYGNLSQKQENSLNSIISSCKIYISKFLV